MRWRQTCCGLDEHVEPLAGNETAQPQDHEGIGIHAETRPCPRTVLRSGGNEPIGIDPGGHDDRWKRTPSGAFGLCCRIAAGSDDDAGLSKDAGEQRSCERKATGNGDLGAVQHHAIGALESRSELAEWQRRIEQHEIGIDLGGECINAPHQ